MSWHIRLKAEVGDLRLDVDFHGEHGPLALIGPNGSGKTTLLRAITGAQPLTEGHIEIGSEVLYSATDSVNVSIDGRGLGYVPQGYGLFPHLTVMENVAFGLSVGALRKARTEAMEAAATALENLECLHLSDRRPGRLSGGEKQRVALARALVVEPSLLLLDEPLAALDATARRTVRRFLANHLRSLKLPSIVVTHDVRDVKALDAEICVLEAGRIVQQGSLDDIRREPATDFVAEFVGVDA